MNKLEKNKLIAEFMGYTFVPHPTDKTLFGGFEKGSVFIRENSMDYDQDWNRLMTVVDKIESFENENKEAKYNFDIQQSFVEIIENHTSETIVELDRDTKKEAVYNAVAEFIQWHNEQPKV